MTAPSVPTSAEVAWHEAREDARSSARALFAAVAWLLLVAGVWLILAATAWWLITIGALMETAACAITAALWARADR